MDDEVAWTHLVGVHRAAGRLAATSHVATGAQGLLAEELTVGDQGQAPGRELQPLQLRRAGGFQRQGRVLFNQPFNRWRIAWIGNEAADAVVFLQQGHRSAGLSGNQPDRGFLLLESLDQIAEFAELIGIGRHRATGEVKAVGMAVLLQQLCHVNAMKGLGQAIGLVDRALQNSWPEQITFLLR